MAARLGDMTSIMTAHAESIICRPLLLDPLPSRHHETFAAPGSAVVSSVSEVHPEARKGSLLRRLVDEAAVLVVGVNGPVADGRRDRPGPVVADRREALRGDLGADAKAANVRQAVDEPTIVDVVMQRHAD